jgi:hypothetical protein
MLDRRGALRARVGVAADRAGQPPQPLDVELVLAAEVEQHLRPSHPTQPVVMRQLQIADQRPVLPPPLRRSQVHAHTSTTDTGRHNSLHPRRPCAHAYGSASRPTWLYKAKSRHQTALKCPSTAELRRHGVRSGLTFTCSRRILRPPYTLIRLLRQTLARRGQEARTRGIWFTATAAKLDMEKEVNDGHQRLVQTAPRPG